MSKEPDGRAPLERQVWLPMTTAPKNGDAFWGFVGHSMTIPKKYRGKKILMRYNNWHGEGRIELIETDKVFDPLISFTDYHVKAWCEA